MSKEISKLKKTKPVIFLVSIFLFVIFVNNLLVSTRLVNEKSALADKLMTFEDNMLVRVMIDKKEYLFEVVNTEESRKRGLSGRREIKADGMLFVFDELGYHGIWMKEMLFDIELIWVMDDRVVEITKNVLAPEAGMSLQDLPSYFPKQVVNIVIEVKKGFVEANEIEIGDELVLVDE